MPHQKTPRSVVMTTAEAAEYVGLAESTLEKLRVYSSDGPPFLTLGTAVRYRIKDIDAWLADRVSRSVGERRTRAKRRNRRPPDEE